MLGSYQGYEEEEATQDREPEGCGDEVVGDEVLSFGLGFETAVGLAAGVHCLKWGQLGGAGTRKSRGDG